MLQRTMERGANAVVGYSLTDAQIFGGIGFAALSPSVYHNKQFFIGNIHATNSAQICRLFFVWDRGFGRRTAQIF